MKDSQQEKDEYFIYTQQIATELHEKDDLIYRSPNKVLNLSKWYSKYDFLFSFGKKTKPSFYSHSSPIFEDSGFW